MVILHLLAPGSVGGLERVVQALAQGHQRRGFDVHVAALLHDGSGGNPFCQALEAARVSVHALRLPARAYRRERTAVRRLCLDTRPSVVHTHGYRPDILHSPVARSLGIPVVSTVHGFTGGGPKLRLYEWLQMRALRRFDAVVAVSQPLAAKLGRRGVNPERVTTIPNAWCETVPLLSRAEARHALDVPADRFHIGWVGRLSREKGPDVFIEALARLDGLPLAASIVGDGPDRRRLEARAAALGLAPRVRWHGTLPDAARYFGGFDVFVLSSRTEGTPVVLFEAMAAGVPIVTTPVGGVPDVVTSGEAWYAASENPATLAAAIRAVLFRPAEAAERSAAALARLQRRFALEPWLARYAELYENAGPCARLAVAATGP